MSRQLRIEYEGAYYHILSRGNAGSDIFLCDDDRKDFIDLLGEMSERFDVDIYAYVLMTNHYHLLLRTRKANLSKSLQWFGTGYTRRFNLRHSRCGHLFQGRYKSILVEDDASLIQLSCYIHRNPLRAGVVKRLSDYEWSSYRCYAYKRPQPKMLETGLILSCISGKDKHHAYREKVQRYSDKTGRIWEDVKYGLVFGSHAFQKMIKDNYLSGIQDQELPQLNRFLKDDDPGILLKKCAAILDCNVEIYKSAARLTGEDKDKRDILIYALWETGKYTNNQIGELLGLTFSSVSRRAKIAKSEISGKPQMEDALKRIRAIIKG